MEKLEADNTVTYTINLDDAAALFIYENLKHKKLIKCVYGILRHICKAIIPCYLIFTTHGINVTQNYGFIPNVCTTKMGAKNIISTWI